MGESRHRLLRPGGRQRESSKHMRFHLRTDDGPHRVLQSLRNAFSNHRVMRSAFNGWVRAKAIHQEVRREIGIADRRRDRKLKRVALAKWRAAMTHCRSREVSADAFSSAQQDRKKASALRIWRLSLSANRFVDHRDTKVASSAFNRWRQRTSLLREREKQKEELLQVTWNARIATHAFATWRRRTAKRRSVEASMTRAYQTSLISRSLSKWREQVQVRHVKHANAVAFDKTRSAKHAIGHWRDLLRARAADRFSAKREQIKLREHFARKSRLHGFMSDAMLTQCLLQFGAKLLWIESTIAFQWQQCATGLTTAYSEKL